MPAQLNAPKGILMAALVVASCGSGSPAADHSSPANLPDPASLLQPVSQPLTGDELFGRLLQHNRLRDSHLLHYDAERTYRVSNDQGKIYAQEVVDVQYQAPDRKNFVTVSEEGSPLVRHLVLKRLIQSEEEAASGREHRNSAIRPDNYSFILLGEQDLGSYHCYVVQAIPLRMDKYLFVGKVWISTEDFGIVRIEGQPARKLSFWITRADFVRQYQKMGEFWLPVKDETIVHVRMNANKVLTIDHRNYVINSAPEAGDRNSINESEAKGK
jgi:hypothetical protein